MPTKIFFSYSHKDEALRNQLEVHLSMLKKEGLIESWHDRCITAGSPLKESIDEQLRDSDLLLLLVSPDFLASNECYDKEMSHALKRYQSGELRIIPVILRACDWHSTPLRNLLAVPKDGKPVNTWEDIDQAFLDVAKSIRSTVEEINRNARTKDDLTPLHEAASKNKNPEFAKALIEKGADVNARTKDGLTPLHKAASENKNPEVAKALIEKGADIYARTKDGLTPLHKAASDNENLEVIKTLLENWEFEPVDAKAKDGLTPLHKAASDNENLEVIKTLIEKRADVNAKTKDGLTPLHKAVSGNENLEVIRMLIENGATVCIRTKDGKTPLHYWAAKHNNNPEVIKVLIENM